jgi:hypothetical protein
LAFARGRLVANVKSAPLLAIECGFRRRSGCFFLCQLSHVIALHLNGEADLLTDADDLLVTFAPFRLGANQDLRSLPHDQQLAPVTEINIEQPFI